MLEQIFAKDQERRILHAYRDLGYRLDEVLRSWSTLCDGEPKAQTLGATELACWIQAPRDRICRL